MNLYIYIYPSDSFLSLEILPCSCQVCRDLLSARANLSALGPQQRTAAQAAQRAGYAALSELLSSPYKWVPWGWSYETMKTAAKGWRISHDVVRVQLIHVNYFPLLVPCNIIYHLCHLSDQHFNWNIPHGHKTLMEPNISKHVGGFHDKLGREVIDVVSLWSMVDIAN